MKSKFIVQLLIKESYNFESSPFAFVCFEISTLLKLEILSFRRVEISSFRRVKILSFRRIEIKQTQKQMIQTIICTTLSFIKYIYSEKATKFCEISTLLLSYVVAVKSKVEILQNFVAFSEYIYEI